MSDGRMQGPPSPATMQRLLADAIGDSLKRRNAWLVEREGDLVRVRVPVLPKGVTGVIGLVILTTVSAAMLGGMGFMVSKFWTDTTTGSVAIDIAKGVLFTLVVAFAAFMALVGIWHIVLFVHLPESRKPDAMRIDPRECSFPRLGVTVPRPSCRAVRVVNRPDPPGISKQSEAPRQDLRIVCDDQGDSRELIAIPHGARLGQRIAAELSVPLEKVVGPPWEL